MQLTEAQFRPQYKGLTDRTRRAVRDYWCDRKEVERITRRAAAAAAQGSEPENVTETTWSVAVNIKYRRLLRVVPVPRYTFDEVATALDALGQHYEYVAATRTMVPSDRGIGPGAQYIPISKRASRWFDSEVYLEFVQNPSLYVKASTPWQVAAQIDEDRAAAAPEPLDLPAAPEGDVDVEPQ